MTSADRREPPDLGTEAPFEPQRAVSWFSPGELVHTGLRLAATTVFTRYADKREQMAHTPQVVFERHARSADGAAWLDFVSDIGDGFHATYSVAHQLGQESLTPDGSGGALPRGDILVMGGDEVYPTASEQAYENRTVRLYEAAFPRSEDGRDAPWLFAIPGNHDWYDGLTAFPRVFERSQWRSEEAWIGGWHTRQTRSYAAIRLPHRWWLFALDIQLDTYVDLPQLRYFSEAASRLQPGDGVILVTAKPCWYRDRGGVSSSYQALQYVAEKVIAPTGAQVRLVLTGDRHHYARYAEARYAEGARRAEARYAQGARQFITSGNGGAYLSATHDLADEVSLPPLEDRAGEAVTLRLESRFPAAEASAALVEPVRDVVAELNPGIDRLMAGMYGVVGATAAGGRTLTAAALAAGLSGGAIGLADPGDEVPEEDRAALKRQMGLRHAARHLAAVGAVAAGGAVAGRAAGAVLGRGSRPVAAALAAGLGAAVGRRVGPRILGNWLADVGAEGANLNEVLSAQGVEDYKGFLRIRVGADGLTVYPLAVHPVCRAWSHYDATAVPRIAPQEPIATALIEEPIHIPREAP